VLARRLLLRLGHRWKRRQAGPRSWQHAACAEAAWSKTCSAGSNSSSRRGTAVAVGGLLAAARAGLPGHYLVPPSSGAAAAPATARAGLQQAGQKLGPHLVSSRPAGAGTASKGGQ
jgi:hypothetical protein